MIRPIRSVRSSGIGVSPEDFADDKPFAQAVAAGSAARAPDTIDGVELIPLSLNKDARGHLAELSSFDQKSEPLVHVYRVTAAPGSVRAWVYHKRQFDRLAFTEGQFEIVLFDLRKESATYGMLNVFHLGEDNSAVLRIPPFVVHGVKNIGTREASFVNMPTRRYDPASPDKSRLPKNDPRIPYSFDA